MNSYYRTHHSTLSSAELRILDVVFDGAAPRRLLRDSVFFNQWALPSHGLNDDELDTVYFDLEKRGYVNRLESTKGPILSITECGAKAWEIEREPVWSKYCSIRQSARLKNCAILSVCAVSQSTRDDFIESAIFQPIRLKTATISDPSLLKWKSFDRIYVGLASYVEEQQNPEGFIEYSQHLSRVEETRTWWSSVRQLQKFQRNKGSETKGAQLID